MIMLDLSMQQILTPIFSPINTTNTNVYIGNSLRPFNGKLGMLKV